MNDTNNSNRSIRSSSSMAAATSLLSAKPKSFSQDQQNDLLLLVTRPLPRDGGMAEDHGAPEAGQLPRVWTRGRTETESCQRVSAAKSSLVNSAE